VKKILNKVVNVIGWLVLLLAFSSIGFATSKPAQGVPLYMLFFLLVFAGVYYYVSKQKHDQKKVAEKNNIFARSLSDAILIVSLLVPWFVFSKINLTVYNYIVIFNYTYIMNLGIRIAIRTINRAGENTVHRIAEYLSIVIMATVPVTALYRILGYFNALGIACWYIVTIAVFLRVKKYGSLPRTIGAVILVLALYMPWFVFAKINLASSTYIIIIALNAVIIFLALLAVRIINRAGENIVLRLAGYLILVALSAIPAIAAIYFFLPHFNRPYDALGTAYWCTIAIALFAWWGFSLVGKKS